MEINMQKYWTAKILPLQFRDKNLVLSISGVRWWWVDGWGGGGCII